MPFIYVTVTTLKKKLYFIHYIKGSFISFLELLEITEKIKK